MSTIRKTYTAEFKLQAVQMILDQKLSVAEVSRRLGVAENLLHAWKKAFHQQGESAFPAPGQPSPLDDELRRLRAEVTRLHPRTQILDCREVQLSRLCWDVRHVRDQNLIDPIDLKQVNHNFLGHETMVVKMCHCIDAWN